MVQTFSQNTSALQDSGQALYGAADTGLLYVMLPHLKIKLEMVKTKQNGQPKQGIGVHF